MIERRMRKIVRTWSHDPPVGLLQLPEYVAGTDLPLASKMWVVGGMGMKDFQRLRGCLYRALIMYMKADLLEGHTISQDYHIDMYECLRIGAL
jgi:hypothetical protein